VLDLKLIRDNPDILQKALADRGQRADEVEALLSSIRRLDTERRQTLTTLQEAQSRRNQISKDVGKAKGAKDEALAQKLMAEIGDLKDRIAQGEAREKEISAELDALLAGIPNIPGEDVPLGGEEANTELRRHGSPREFNFAPKQHFELGEALGLMDFETAAKLSGSRFVVLKGALARMERALANFMLDTHTHEFAYEEVNPPLLVKDEATFGTAQLPKFESDLFSAKATEIIGPDEATIRASDTPGIPSVTFHGHRAKHLQAAFFKDSSEYTGRFQINRPRFEADGTISNFHPVLESNWWLIPTAEVSLTNLVRQSILGPENLPMRLTAHTPCFRSEAGAAGKDTRGMIRLHQFSKVELVSITTQEQSEEEHERMTRCAETVLEKLGLPYRTIVLASGDMGFSAKKTYDIEVWLPGQNAYREISSCSNCGDFQARRMNARYRPKDAKELRFVHTLNGSGLAVGRTLVAVLENYQEKDGSIRVPDVLVPYMDGLEVIKA
jgi:seryl-tRNA synthetase